MPSRKTPSGTRQGKSTRSIVPRDRYITQGLRTALPIRLVRGQGSHVWDDKGRRYTDLGTGIGVHNAGHRPAAVIRAAKDQLDRLTHTSYMVAEYEGYTRLAKELAELSPAGLQKSILLNSGSEAVENAVKIARAHTRRAGIVSFRTAFHGRTLLNVSLTGKEKPYREGFGPFIADVHLAEFPNPYRDPEQRAPPELAKACVEDIEAALQRPANEGRFGALIAEPVQGEGGMIVPPKDFFPLLRRLCDKHGLLLLDDEVQAGAGRTGRWWAIEHWRTKPDMIISGKAVGGGLPYGGVTGRSDVMDAAPSASLGGTFGGNPVVCAAALAAIPLLRAAMRNAPRVEDVLRRRLIELQSGFDSIGDVRGLGGMFAVEFVKDPRTKEPDAELARSVQLEGLKRGLILLTAGFHNNCIRFLPPLNIRPALLEEAMDAFAAAMEAAVTV